MNRLEATETFVRVMDSAAFGLALEGMGAADAARGGAFWNDAADARGFGHMKEPG